MAAGWFRKLTIAGPAVFKSSITATTGTLTNKTVTAQTVSASSQLTGSKGVINGYEKKTHSTGQATLLTYGVSFLTATAASTYTLGPPAAPGVVKYIFLSSGASNLTVKTTATFFNSTATKINMIGGKAHAGKPIGFTLVGATASKWALINSVLPTASTALTIS